MKCEICQREFHSRRRDAKTCSSMCRMERNRRTAKEFSKLHRKKDRESEILETPGRWEKEMMMEGLHRLLFTPEDEVRLLFGQAQDLGRGLKYKEGYV